MTIIEAIEKADALKPNTYTQSEKIMWLSTLDTLVKRGIIDKHESSSEIDFDGYNDDTPLDTELLIYSPYDDAYIHWLHSKIDFYNGEYVKYNNSIIKFNDNYMAYSHDYNQNNLPKGKKIKFF